MIKKVILSGAIFAQTLFCYSDFSPAQKEYLENEKIKFMQGSFYRFGESNQVGGLPANITDFPDVEITEDLRKAFQILLDIDKGRQHDLSIPSCQGLTSLLCATSTALMFGQYNYFVQNFIQYCRNKDPYVLFFLETAFRMDKNGILPEDLRDLIVP